jgi:hypothetical protein
LFINAELSTLPVTDGRKAERRILNIAAALREAGATTTQVLVLDVSSGGFRAQVAGPLEQGAEMWLKLPGLEAKRSRVVWCKEDEAGFEFESELHPGCIEALAAPRRRTIAKNVFRRA